MIPTRLLQPPVVFSFSKQGWRLPMESPSPRTSNPNPNPNLSTTDIPTAISLLKDVTLVAESTIESVSSYLSSSTWRNPDFFCVCPYDPRHQMPPESLFRHSLLCSSSPGTPLFDHLGLLETLHYPNSLKSESQLQNENRFLSSPPHESDAAADLCFSLDDGACEPPLDSSRFFYKDCPGVVSLPNPSIPEAPEDSSNKTFLLPAILSVECANFTHHCHLDGERTMVSAGEIRLLPSEFWVLRREVEAWTDYPTTYSYTVLRLAASGLHKVQECGLNRWIISNSPRFGILIDAAMRDHVFVLFKLCLKAIRIEALSSLKSLLSDESSISNLNTMCFGSPKLVCSLTWLASHLSVLYGEANSKFFTIGMLRESFLRVGLNSMLFKLGQGNCGQDDCGITGDSISVKICEYSQSKSAGGLELKKNLKDCDLGRIFVSQIAAAVAALHERFLLEERIKALRFPRLLCKSQLVKEYLNASKRACAIRENRPNYRAVSEHDGLLWQRGSNQGSGKAKTREELLAEERDYKRRRMSYRGKKVKRNTTEVLRDIIEEHMEEIIQAGGIGCDAKATVRADDFPIIQNSNDRTANIHKFQTEVASPGYEKPLHLYSNDGSKIIMDMKYRKKEPSFECFEHQEGYERRNHKEEKNCGSRGPSLYRNHDNLQDQFTHLNEQGDARAQKTLFQREVSAYNPRYKDHIFKSTAHDTTNQGHKQISENRGMNRGRTDSLKSAKATEIEDRYDPSTSYDEADDSYGDLSLGNDYLRSKKCHSSRQCDEFWRHDLYDRNA